MQVKSKKILPLLHTVEQLIADPKCLMVVNHSGGKDSQAMLIKLLELGIPKHRIIAIHADLHEVEWAGTQEHAQAQCDAAGIRFIVARAVTGRGAEAVDKSFFDMVRLAKVRNDAAQKVNVSAFPTKGCRECTSGLKRDPINKQAIRYANAHGFDKIVSCEGLRAEESDDRANAPVFARNGRLEGAGRTGYSWLPIHALSTVEVFACIAQAGQQPHRAYALGNSRLSCVVCIMASFADIRNGAQHEPEKVRALIALEREVGGQLHMSRKPLAEIVAGVEGFTEEALAA